MKLTSFVSVITPVFDSRQHLLRSLSAIRQSTYRPFELIVVDDASTDDSAQVARTHGARVVSLDRQLGPAAARNRGAEEASGDLLLFVDADVLIRPDTIVRVVEDFTRMPDIAAVFGSYDDEPAEKNFFSQYKNLLHHFVHQQSRSDAISFWAGCGAVRREVFAELGGFDEDRYSFPSIEDIELGHRMVQKGYRIYLDKELQVKHLKRWDLINLLRTDIFYRAVPWSSLILQSGRMPNALNLELSQRISAGLVMMLLAAFGLACVRTEFIYLTPLLALAVCLINCKLYRFLFEKRGIWFALRTVPMQFSYYFYSFLVFAISWLDIRLSNRSQDQGRK